MTTEKGIDSSSESASIEEQVSKGNVQQVAIIANGMAGKDFDKLKVSVLVKLYGEKIAYECSYKVSRELLNPDQDVLEQFFGEMSKQFRKVLEGKVELNAIV